MKIIENNFKKLRCTECDSVVEIESDADFVYSYIDDCYTVTCPVCGAKRWLETSNPLVQEFIYHRIKHR